MTTDFRALCAELAHELDAETGYTRSDGRRIVNPAVVRARAALAEPEPEGPTDGELLRTYGLAKRDHCYEGPIDDWPRRAERAATVAGLRAVLARWGRPAPQPVPVSERLPEPGDCDAEGECYWFDPEGSGAWYQDTCQGNYTHWLPVHALPMPQ